MKQLARLIFFLLVITLNNGECSKATVKQLKQNAHLSECHFVVNALSVPKLELIQWINHNSQGVTIDSFDSSRALSRQLLRSAHCLVFIDSGKNISQALYNVDRVGAQSKVLFVDLDGYDVDLSSYVSKKLSFDVVLLTWRQEVVVYCSGMGNAPIVMEKRLSSCRDQASTLRNNTIQAFVAMRLAFTLLPGERIGGADINILRIGGADIDILKILQSKFGFKYKLKVETNFGIERLANRTAVGFLASLDSRESDIGLGELIATGERLKYADFSPPTYYTKYVFLVPMPRRINTQLEIIHTMEYKVWALTGTALLLIMVVMNVIDSVRYTFKNTHFVQNMIISYSALIQYDVPSSWIQMKANYSKAVLFCFWLLSSMFISMAFKSILLAKLTVWTYELPIDTPRAIIDSDLPVAMSKSSSIELLIKTSPLPELQEIYRRSVASNYIFPFNGTLPPGIARLVGTNSVIFPMDATLAGHFNGHLTKFAVASQSTHILFPKFSRTLLLFNPIIGQLTDMGILQKLLIKYTGMLGRQPQNEALAHSSEALSLNHLLSVIIIYGAGLVLAIITFFVHEKGMLVRVRTFLL